MKGEENLFKEIEDFLKGERNKTITESPRCQYCLPFSFMCPEGTNMCTNVKAEKTERSKCVFLGHQLDCPYYEPDPNYPVLVCFRKLEEKAEYLESQFKDTKRRETLEELIGVTRDLLKLLKESSFISGHRLAYLHYRFQLVELMKLEKQIPAHRRILTKFPWFKKY